MRTANLIIDRNNKKTEPLYFRAGEKSLCIQTFIPYIIDMTLVLRGTNNEVNKRIPISKESLEHVIDISEYDFAELEWSDVIDIDLMKRQFVGRWCEDKISQHEMLKELDELIKLAPTENLRIKTILQ